VEMATVDPGRVGGGESRDRRQADRSSDALRTKAATGS